MAGGASRQGTWRGGRGGGGRRGSGGEADGGATGAVVAVRGVGGLLPARPTATPSRPQQRQRRAACTAAADQSLHSRPAGSGATRGNGEAVVHILIPLTLFGHTTAGPPLPSAVPPRDRIPRTHRLIHYCHWLAHLAAGKSWLGRRIADEAKHQISKGSLNTIFIWSAQASQQME